jgi:hypothetical protein
MGLELFTEALILVGVAIEELQAFIWHLEEPSGRFSILRLPNYLYTVRRFLDGFPRWNVIFLYDPNGKTH